MKTQTTPDQANPREVAAAVLFVLTATMVILVASVIAQPLAYLS